MSVRVPLNRACLVDDLQAEKTRFSPKTDHFRVAFAGAVGVQHVVDQQLFQDEFDSWQQLRPPRRND